MESQTPKTTLIPSAPSTPPAMLPPLGTGNRHGSGADPRERVTPEAFFVAPELLGKPLARPFARGGAWLVDGAIVGMLSQVSTFLLAVALALLSYQLIGKRRQQNNGNGQLATVGKWPFVLMAIFVLWAVLSVVDWFDRDDGDEPAARPAAALIAAPTGAPEDTSPLQQELQRLRAENAALKAGQEGFSLLETGRRMLDDIGFGFGWAAVYFSLLTAWWQGQTVGKRLFGLRVLKLNGKPLSVWESFNRCGGYAAGFATGLLGFAQIFWDANRQAIHDQIAFTVVVDTRRS